jgi:hypothetical protein
MPASALGIVGSPASHVHESFALGTVHGDERPGNEAGLRGIHWPRVDGIDGDAGRGEFLSNGRSKIDPSSVGSMQSLSSPSMPPYEGVGGWMSRPRKLRNGGSGVFSRQRMC